MHTFMHTVTLYSYWFLPLFPIPTCYWSSFSRVFLFQLPSKYISSTLPPYDLLSPVMTYTCTILNLESVYEKLLFWDWIILSNMISSSIYSPAKYYNFIFILKEFLFMCVAVCEYVPVEYRCHVDWMRMSELLEFRRLAQAVVSHQTSVLWTKHRSS